MNPIRFLLLLAIAALICSCSKDYIAPENQLIESNSAIELFYLDETQIQESDRRAVLFNRQWISQPCKSNTPSILIPQIIVGDSIKIIYANISEFTDRVSTTGIRWIVDGKTENQVTSTLFIPYDIDEFDIEAIVTLEDGNERFYNFTINITENMPLDNDGYIKYNVEDICVTGTMVGPSCLPEAGRAIGIVIVDPVF